MRVWFLPLVLKVAFCWLAIYVCWKYMHERTRVPFYVRTNVQGLALLLYLPPSVFSDSWDYLRFSPDLIWQKANNCPEFDQMLFDVNIPAASQVT
ncbi:hypothetical protein A4A49_03674 [Nicotiana attenuata]|uniref:Uncharacterized protein n=1 Tax=Nicotiana attenuata TaxID=49451 RepID=A0A314L2N6_NICAT|nr:hypothetical protein A4A49_03674 [Nicotiana attenuata]